ncbi:hypothetical protein SAMN05421880_10119 [Nitrosomonas nitrosa]|uniref:Uncharacterized protein n=1 Tax=Nitrosomonas nitrosa TaxID=52442 RepID=A0A1I4KSE8_9PROT|nr:hypothetical protein [Nitrosomonas nitrosa]SFL81668.1 hypothetical protein SAMN05421880_10119 [Nitrosomonas nitrosa]
MNSVDPIQLISEGNRLEFVARSFLEESECVNRMISRLVFIRELFNLNKTSDQSLENEKVIDLSEHQLMGLYELINDEFISALPDISERIQGRMKYAPESERGDLFDARESIYSAIGKLSFVLMLAELPPSGTCITLSYQASRGLVRILENIEADLEAIECILDCAGTSLMSSMKSDAGGKTN